MPQQYTVRLPVDGTTPLYQWLEANHRQHHFVRTEVTYPTKPGEPVLLEAILSNRDTAILLKLALS